MSVRIVGVTVLCMVSFLVMGVVVYTGIHRVTYPFELSKMEGLIVDHARLLATGRSIYEEPSAEFVPLLYTPVYYYVTSWFIKAGMDGFHAARLVGLLGIGGAIALGMWLVYHASPHKWLCVLVPVLVAAKYFDVAAFYDQARSDNLLSLFIMLAIVALTLRSAMVAVLLFSLSSLLAVLTKQSALLPVFGLAIGMLFVRWRVSLACIVSLSFLLVASVLWINAVTDGWFWIYTVEIPSYHRFSRGGLLKAVTGDFLGSFAITSTLILLTAVTFVQERRSTNLVAKYDTSFEVLLISAISCGGFSVASMSQPMAMKNVLVMYAVIGAVFLPIAVGWLVDHVRSPQRRAICWNLAIILFSLVIGRGLQNPAGSPNYLPTSKDQKTWSLLRETLAEYGPPETTWVTLHGSAWGAAAMAPIRLHMGALFDYVGGHFGRATGYAIPQDLIDSIKKQYFTVIVVADWDNRAKRLIGRYYEPDPARSEVYIPAFSGFMPAKESLWIPRFKPILGVKTNH